MGIRDVIVLGFFLASAPACFFRPFYGVLLWVVVAFLNPHRFAWYASQNFPIALLIAVPTVLGMLLFTRDWKSLKSREVLLIIALQVWFTITSFAAAGNSVFVHHIGETWEKWGFVSKVLIMTGVTVIMLNSFSRLRALILVVAGCFGILVAKAFPFILMTGGSFRLFGPEQSMIGDNNDFGLALNMTLPLFFCLARSESNPKVRKLFAFLFVITIPAVFCTYSRGALLGLIVVSGLMFLQMKERYLLIPVALIALLVVGLAAPEAWLERMDPSREGAVDASAKGRLNAWTYAFNLACDYPITGGGFSTFTRELFTRYAPPGAVIIGPHSVYFGLLAEHGFVGLGLYLTLVISCFATARQISKWAHHYGDTQIIHYVNMFRFSLIAFLTSGTFLGRAYFDYFFTIVACLAVLKRIAFEKWEQEEAEDEEEDEEGEISGTSDWSVSHA
jgi:probable O-glycosylation ligase (exosortase A-associated)